MIFYSKASSYWVTPISGNPHSQAEGAETAGGLSWLCGFSPNLTRDAMIGGCKRGGYENLEGVILEIARNCALHAKTWFKHKLEGLILRIPFLSHRQGTSAVRCSKYHLWILVRSRLLYAFCIRYSLWCTPCLTQSVALFLFLPHLSFLFVWELAKKWASARYERLPPMKSYSCSMVL